MTTGFEEVREVSQPGWYPDPSGSGPRWWDGLDTTVRADPQAVSYDGVTIPLAAADR